MSEPQDGKEKTMPDKAPTMDTILNLSRYHCEHEKFYAQAPLENARDLQQASIILKTLADRWNWVTAGEPMNGNPYAGCEDLNEAAIIQHTGVLFMEGEAEPPEITRLKRALRTLSEDFGGTGEWLARAMASSWETGRPLLQIPALAGVLGERHRIIANDWQAAYLGTLASELIKRSLEILDRIDFSPSEVRADLSGARVFPDYLYSASELIDRAADLASESAMLAHDNERRWRVFRQAVKQLSGPVPKGDGASKTPEIANGSGK